MSNNINEWKEYYQYVKEHPDSNILSHQITEHDAKLCLIEIVISDLEEGIELDETLDLIVRDFKKWKENKQNK